MVKNSCCVKTKKTGPEIKCGIRASAAGRHDHAAAVIINAFPES
jgi:hypothetical protein